MSRSESCSMNERAFVSYVFFQNVLLTLNTNIAPPQFYSFCCITPCLETFNILEHIHLLWEVEAEQAVEATQVGLSGEVQPHDLAQVPVRNVT